MHCGIKLGKTKFQANTFIRYQGMETLNLSGFLTVQRYFPSNFVFILFLVKAYIEPDKLPEAMPKTTQYDIDSAKSVLLFYKFKNRQDIHTNTTNCPPIQLNVI